MLALNWPISIAGNFVLPLLAQLGHAAGPKHAHKYEHAAKFYEMHRLPVKD
jgi:hypothetical protein